MEDFVNIFKNRKAIVTVLVFSMVSMWSCSDSTSINNHSGVESQTNADQNSNKLVRQKPLYTFVNKQKSIKQFSTKQNTHLSAIQNGSKNVNIRMAKFATNPSLMLQKSQMLELLISSQKSLEMNRFMPRESRNSYNKTNAPSCHPVLSKRFFNSISFQWQALFSKTLDSMGAPWQI